MANVKVLNTLTGKPGVIPERIFTSSAFNRDGVFVLYDGPINPDCGCPGSREIPTPETPEEPEPEMGQDDIESEES